MSVIRVSRGFLTGVFAIASLSLPSENARAETATKIVNLVAPQNQALSIAQVDVITATDVSRSNSSLPKPTIRLTLKGGLARSQACPYTGLAIQLTQKSEHSTSSSYDIVYQLSILQTKLASQTSSIEILPNCVFGGAYVGYSYPFETSLEVAGSPFLTSSVSSYGIQFDANDGTHVVRVSFGAQLPGGWKVEEITAIGSRTVAQGD